jgi:NAD(P)-dependent dehydrogenase (short-subunit alcohol dehydrogenase family)
MQISGTSALVTGAGSGLGEATARRLAAAGAKVVAIDKDAAGQAVAGEIGGVFAAVDVADEAGVRDAVQQAVALGPLRVAANCAGVGWSARVVDRGGAPHDYDLFKRVLEINLAGTFNVLRLAAAAMAGNEPSDTGERGVVVNTASIAGFEGQIGAVAYAASKAGVIGMTLAAARDLSSRGIRVVTIAPGLFDTPMLRVMPEPTRTSLTESIPYPPRFGRPDEFAELVLAVAGTPYLNGETIRLDGGLRLTPR